MTNYFVKLLGGGRGQLTYYARTQRGLLLFLLALILPIRMIGFSNKLFYFEIFLIVFTVTGIFTKFKLKIGDGYINYQIFTCNFLIYQKIIFPSQIAQIKFKRVKWATKAAILHVKKGLNIRVVNFAPNNVFEDLVRFANENGVSISKKMGSY